MGSSQLFERFRFREGVSAFCLEAEREVEAGVEALLLRAECGSGLTMIGENFAGERALWGVETVEAVETRVLSLRGVLCPLGMSVKDGVL